MRKNIVLHEDELGNMDSIRWDLQDEGFEVLWDSALSRREVNRYMTQFYQEYTKFDTTP